MSAHLAAADLETLREVATIAIHRAVSEWRTWRPDPDDYPAQLRAPGAAFVTLRRNGRLRGCIGTLDFDEPLVACVAARARAAALHDPRFQAVKRDELDDLTVEISVLTEPEPMNVDSYEDLLQSLRPGVDGVIVEADRHRATLLPAVWDDEPSAATFIAALWRKAGLRPGAWPAGIRVERYAAQKWPV